MKEGNYIIEWKNVLLNRLLCDRLFIGMSNINSNGGLVCLTDDGLICIVDCHNILTKYVNMKVNGRGIVGWKDRLLVGGEKGMIKILDQSRLGHI